MDIRRIALSLFALMLIVPGVVMAQDYQLSGKIVDNNKKPIKQGIVLISNKSGEEIAAIVSDGGGQYQGSVPEGTYTITINGPKGDSYYSQKISSYKISKDSTLDITLKSPTIEKKSDRSALPIIIPIMVVVLLAFLIFSYLMFRKRLKAKMKKAKSF